MTLSNDPSTSLHRNMRILLVSEPTNMAMQLAQILPSGGHDVLGPVKTWNEALTLTGHAPPSLALLSIASPGNPQILETARGVRETWGTPLLIMSDDVPKPEHGEIALAYMKVPLDHAAVLDSIGAIGELLAGRLPRRIPPALELIGLPR